MPDVKNQHATNNGDSPKFTERVPTSPEFGVCDLDYQTYKGTVPGTPQWEPLSPDPELSS